MGRDGFSLSNGTTNDTNAQGRFLNDSANACTEPASIASDRFIHMEQNRSIRESEVNKAKVIQALDVILRQ